MKESQRYRQSLIDDALYEQGLNTIKRVVKVSTSEGSRGEPGRGFSEALKQAATMTQAEKNEWLDDLWSNTGGALLELGKRGAEKFVASLNPNQRAILDEGLNLVNAFWGNDWVKATTAILITALPAIAMGATGMFDDPSPLQVAAALVIEGGAAATSLGIVTEDAERMRPRWIK